MMKHTMTQDKTETRRSTRIDSAPPDLFDPNEPRIDRRESEPHSEEVTYLYDVISTNFPKDHALWDIHHYFQLNEKEIYIQFDISFFKGLSINQSLSSYRAKEFNNRVPNLAINILSKSTWKEDLSENIDICRMLRVSLYVVFFPYHVASEIYKPPFLRVYQIQEDQYHIEEIHEVTIREDGSWNPKAIIDVSKFVPFRLGLTKLEKVHENQKERYRLILIDEKENVILLNRLEKEKKRADEEKKRADNYFNLLKNHGINPEE